MSGITKFEGNYRWLSNFWLSQVILKGYVYPTVENAYQAAKLPEGMREVFLTCSPGKAKEMGRDVELPKDWDTKKLNVMRALLDQKFRIGTFNAELLMNTLACEIVEGNHWGDIFWGVCEGEGENHLGKMLMGIRNELSKQVN